jgi:hypothetical protein
MKRLVTVIFLDVFPVAFFVAEHRAHRGSVGVNHPNYSVESHRSTPPAAFQNTPPKIKYILTLLWSLARRHCNEVGVPEKGKFSTIFFEELFYFGHSIRVMIKTPSRKRKSSRELFGLELLSYILSLIQATAWRKGFLTIQIASLFFISESISIQTVTPRSSRVLAGSQVDA